MKYLLKIILFLLGSQICIAQSSTINYIDNSVSVQKSTINFLNPERGLYRQISVYTSNDNSYTPVMEALDSASLVSYRNTDSVTLLLRLYYMPAFVSSDISQSYLDMIAKDCAALRAVGMKMIMRFAYSKTTTHGHADDASYTQVLSHINQLKNTFQANSDVIAVVQAGFIGGYGEWAYADPSFYTTTPYSSATRDYTKYKGVVDALIAALPTDRMIQVRTPEFKQIMYSTGTGSANALQVANAHDGSTLARIGHHNDCFISSPSDYGTYNDSLTEKQYLEQDTRFLPMGGETCLEHGTNGDRENCSSVTDGKADIEMDRFHFSYLHKDYYTPTNDKWKTQTANPKKYGTCYEDVQRRLGYRFELQTGTFTNTTVEQGCSLGVDIRMINKGYSAPFNPRLVELILESTTDASEFYVVQLSNQDPRTWYKEAELAEIVITETIGVSADIPTGTYNLYLKLPDSEYQLYSNPNFCIRLANNEVWQTATGYNDLKQIITVTNSACGTAYAGSQWFSDNDVELVEISNPALPNCSGLTHSPTIVVKNNGSQTVTSLTINSFNNGIAQTTLAWTGSLAPNASTTISLASSTFAINDWLEITISNPNGNKDINPSNDTKSITIYNGMSGTYTLGGSSPDYENFETALSDLYNRGVCSAVIFDVRDGTYTEQVSIESIPGASSTNTITFRSENSVAANCILTYSATSYLSKHTLLFDNTKYINFEKMTIAASNSTYGWAVHLYGAQTSNIQVNDCVITTSSSSTSSHHVGVVINGSTTSYTTGSNVENCTIKGNTITGGHSGISLVGQAWDNTAANNIIQNNTITQFYTYGIRTAAQNALTISGNTIVSRNENTSSMGIYGTDIHTVTTSSTFSKNKIYNVGEYGINCESCYGTAGNPHLLVNNMIGGGFTDNTPRGVYLNNCNYWNIYFNSIHLNIDGGSSTTVCPLYINSNSDFVIKNNNLAHLAASGSGTAMRVRSGVTLDNNNYYNAASTNLFRVENTTYTTADYTTGGGSNSVNVAPDFTSNTDLHLASTTSLNNGGVDVSITEDLDGEVRPSNGGYDIGADEGDAVALPVELSYFKGERQGTIHVLEWKTESEINTAYFEIQRSTDGVSFTTIGKVEAQLAPTLYDWSDIKPFTGENYYRLKIVDFDNSFEFSNIVSLYQPIDYDAQIVIYPNPNKGNILNIDFQKIALQSVEITILTANGQLLQQKKIDKIEPIYTTSLKDLSKGVYFLKLTGNNWNVIKRVVIL